MKKVFASVAITIMACLGISSYVVTQAVPAWAESDGTRQADKYIQATGSGQEQDLMPMLQIIINVVLGVLGVICVAMIIVGGIMYTTSQGQPDKVKQAKDIILYSVIGLIIALLAVAIVNFVLVNIFK